MGKLIVVAGLGLEGGSMAKALKKYTDHTAVGVRTMLAPWNRSGKERPYPAFSRPAMGWPPVYRRPYSSARGAMEGGSMAKALKKYTDHRVWGWNRTRSVAEKAQGPEVLNYPRPAWSDLQNLSKSGGRPQPPSCC